MNALTRHPPQVRTVCPYCGVGCGLLATPDGQGGALIAGDPDHPANRGRLCSKGSALGETLSLDGRLLHPMRRRDDGTLARIAWDTALTAVANGFAQVIERHGPGAVAFYLSGQLLTEDYYVANKLMKGFIGSANVDTNSRLCMASSVAGHRRAFGSDTVPGMYEDLDTADLIVLVGSNTAWCHPVLFQRMIANKRERGARIVVIDPRRTATADEADLFLPIAAGTDTALFCGLLCDLAAHGTIDFAYINAHTRGFGAAYARATEIARTVENTAAATGLAAADVARFFEWFRTTPRVVTAFSQGVNQSAQGTDKVNAIINCHLATGRIGQLGMGPFSLTGQPNAMGGREVGGLANQLAAHMNFTPADIDRVGRFWRATRMATHEGLKAVQMFEAIERGEIKALWVMATNPAVSLPRAAAVRAALSRLDVFVASENVLSNDTVDAGAQILLPAAAWGEKDGTVTNSERRISRQRSFLPPPGQAQPDWWIVCEVAKRMGFGAAFSYGSVADVFREHSALSAFENGGARDFDIGGLANITDDEYNAFDPVQWPVPANETECASPSTTRFFAAGGFYTGDYKARFVAPEPPPHPATPLDEAFPFRLNTGRIRDQWHTMTRTGTSPRLGAHLPEPFVAVHPDDARAAGLIDGGFARVTTRHGACVLKVVVTDAQAPGTLFVPIHWSGATSSGGRIGELVAPLTDPHSGQPDSKATPAAISAVTFSSRGFILTRHKITLPDGTWWARVAVRGGHGLLFAADLSIEGWRDCAARWFGADAELAEYLDAQGGNLRLAAYVNGNLAGCIFVGPPESAPQWDAVRAMFEADAIASGPRRTLLSGQSTDGVEDAGPMICACFGVGLNTIRRAIASEKLASAEEIGKALRAGTNCGSCLPELRKIVQAEAVPA
jgi:assimilatory nitrate reductase catalytic subunit